MWSKTGSGKVCFLWFSDVCGRRCPKVVPGTPPGTLKGQMFSNFVEKWCSQFKFVCVVCVFCHCVVLCFRWFFSGSGPRLGGKTWGGSPLTWDVPQMPSTHFRFDLNVLIKKSLKNTVQTYCICLSKMEPKRTPKCARYRTIVTQILKKTSHENMHIQMTKQGETQALQCFIFESSLE